MYFIRVCPNSFSFFCCYPYCTFNRKVILIGVNMQNNITLSTGRTIGHRPYLINGIPNGATEAFVIEGGEMSNAEWVEYCQITNPKVTA